MTDDKISDWVDALMGACPGFGQREKDKRPTQKSRFFWNWFLDLTSPVSRVMAFRR